MPVYEYKCTAGHKFDRFLPLSQYLVPQVCDCGAESVKIIASAPAVRGDYAGYECPVTGDWVEGKRAHEENLKRTGCRILEPGETEAFKRRKAAEDDALAESIAETAAAEVAAMPPAKQERLANELASGLDVSFERQSA